MTSSHHAPYVLGYTRGYIGRYKGLQTREGERNPKKPGPGSDWRLKLASMKAEC